MFKRFNIRHGFIRALLCAGMVAGGTVFAQDYPNRTIRLVVNSAIGGTVDITARLLATHLSEALKQPVIVEIRDGAGGVVGANVVARAPADGYTFLYASAGITSFAALKKSLPFDPVADLVRKDSVFEKLGLNAADYVTPGAVIDLLLAHPKLLQRPVVMKGSRAIIGRPKDRVSQLLS